MTTTRRRCNDDEEDQSFYIAFKKYPFPFCAPFVIPKIKFVYFIFFSIQNKHNTLCTNVVSLFISFLPCRPRWVVWSIRWMSHLLIASFADDVSLGDCREELGGVIDHYFYGRRMYSATECRVLKGNT